MRICWIFVVACGGGASVSGDPSASIVTSECDRLGPDGTGFMVDSQYAVVLDVGQAFTAELVFPTGEAPVNRSDIYNCGFWTTTGFGGDAEGCQRDVGQDETSEQVSHSLAIEFPTPVPSPVVVTINAKVIAAPGSTTEIDVDTQTVSCP